MRGRFYNPELKRREPRELILTVNEAAYVAGVSVKAVNQAIDREHIRTRTLGRRADRAKRGLRISEVVYLRARHVLAPEVRTDLYRSLRGKSLHELPRTFERGDIVMDLSQAIQNVENRLEMLSRVEDRIESDPGVRSGDPVFRGTRIPVYAIARKLELGSTPAELREDHPRLEEGDLEIALLYAELHPRQGRPKADWSRGMKRQLTTS